MDQINEASCFYVVVHYKGGYFSFILKYKSLREFFEHMMDRFGNIPPVICCNFLDDGQCEQFVDLLQEFNQNQVEIFE